MTDHPFPETAAETLVVADLIWGDHPELATIGDVRKAMTEKLNAMRQEQAEFIATQNRNGEFRERYQRGLDAFHVAYDEAYDRAHQSEGDQP